MLHERFLKGPNDFTHVEGIARAGSIRPLLRSLHEISAEPMIYVYMILFTCTVKAGTELLHRNKMKAIRFDAKGEKII